MVNLASATVFKKMFSRLIGSLYEERTEESVLKYSIH